MTENNAIPSTVNAAQIDRTIKYQTNGLLAVTNDTAIVPRNEAGAISIEDGNTDPTILVVEPMIKRVTTKSMLKVVNTQFSYYKFPARTVLEEDPELDLDLDISILDDIDPIYARYAPSENRRILAFDTYSGILLDDVVDGLLQRKPNRYYISKAIKNSGKDLRLRAVIEHRFDSGINQTSVAAFSLIKTSTDTGINRAWKTYRSGDNGRISQYEVQRVLIDEIIPNSELQIGDTYGIGALCLINTEFVYHTITSATTYMSVTDASKQVNEYNELNLVINDTPQVTTTPTTPTPTPVGNYEPFGEGGTTDGETRTYTAGGTLNDIYVWSASTQSWNKQ
jgi:hypothetical protein